MKEFESTVGDSIQQNFLEAWEYFIKNDSEPVTFLHNGIRIILVKDESNNACGLHPFPHSKDRAILVPSGMRFKILKEEKAK